MKATSVLVQLAAPIRHAPPDMRRGALDFLYNWCSGMDARHDLRWRRIWHRLYNAPEEHPSLQLWIRGDRSRPFHARWMAAETRIYAAQDGFYNLEGFREWLKTGAAFGHYEASPAGNLVFAPSSLSWENCSDDEMREFAADALAFLHTPLALATLWPAVREHDRLAMLQACLNPPKDHP